MGIALIGRQAIQAHSFAVVAGNAVAVRVHKTKRGLAGSMSLLGRLAEPRHCHLVVPTCAAAVLVPLAQLGLGSRISPPSHHAKSGDVDLLDGDVIGVALLLRRGWRVRHRRRRQRQHDLFDPFHG